MNVLIVIPIMTAILVIMGIIQDNTISTNYSIFIIILFVSAILFMCIPERIVEPVEPVELGVISVHNSSVDIVKTALIN